MKPIDVVWMSTFRKLFGNGWVDNEVQVMEILIQQQRKLPVSVEQASQQVKRLKEQNLSTVKKGHDTMQP